MRNLMLATAAAIGLLAVMAMGANAAPYGNHGAPVAEQHGMVTRADYDGWRHWHHHWWHHHHWHHWHGEGR